MDIATLIGLVAGFGVIVATMIMGGSISAFFNVPGIVIVFGGTVAAACINQRLKHVLSAAKVTVNAFLDRAKPVQDLIPLIVSLAQKARKEGLVSLEGENIPDPFMARGVQLGVDGLSPEVVTATLASEISSLRRRHEVGQKVLRFMGTTAPSMGMIGTLIGLVQMLRTLDDPSSIGPAMAVALLTTLYGAILAFVVFNPLADKLENRTNEEVASKRLVIEGISSILQGDNSMVIQSKLESFLAPSQRGAKEAG